MHLKKISSHLNLCCRFLEFSQRDTSNRWCHTRRRREDLHRRSSHMSAWQVTSFANGGKVELVKNVEVPIITNSHQVLVKVAYSSVNPLDVEMIRGFGQVLLKNMRLLNSFCNKNNSSSQDLPITLGRDFSGTVVARGSAVTKFQVGDEVFGVIKPEQNGCHAQYALAHDSLVLKKPHHLPLSKASAILYTTLTAWSALRISGHMYFDFSTDSPILVIGASGGVGQAAIQLLKEWKCNVVATCRKDAISIVEKFHPDIIIDYTSPNYLLEIEEACRNFPDKYLIVLDAAGLSENELLKYRDVVHENGTIVTLRSPLLPNIDQYGLLGGGIKTFADLIVANLNYGSATPKMKFRWGYFAATPSAMDEIEDLVKEDKLNPEIEKVYSFSNVDQAYERLKAGHLRGKIIISVEESSQ